MKRRVLAVLFAAVLSAGLFAGCGEKEQESTKTEDTQESEAEDTEEEEKQEPVDEATAEAAGFSDGEEASDSTQDETTEAADDAQNETSENTEEKEETILDTDSSLSGKHHAEINIKDYGTIEVELDADTAPISVTNFVKLAQEDFYDGLTFHRIIDGFMMQGGDPDGDGTGGSKETIKGEFSSNGVENDISHVRGVISMARASDPDSASSQFFIVQTDSEFLDGDYAAFGQVTEGMDIVDKICKEAEPVDNNGLIADEKQPVIESIRILD